MRATPHFRRPICAAWLGSSLVAAWLLGQEPAAPDPFGGPSPSAAEGASDKATDGKTKKKEGPVRVETDPVVLSLREANPQTPAEVLQAMISLARYRRPDEAKRYAAGLLAASLDPAACWKLQRQFGTGPLLQAATNAELQPEGKQLAEKILAGSQQFVRDPVRLDALVGQLAAGSVAERQVILTDLREGGELAAAALVAALADEGRQAQWPVARAALGRLGQTALPPILGSLDADRPGLRTQLVLALASFRTPDALPFLLRPALTAAPDAAEGAAARAALQRLTGRLPQRSEAIAVLQEELLSQLRRAPQGIDAEERQTVWRWDAAAGRPQPVELPVAAYRLEGARRIAAELVALAPDSLDHRELQLVVGLQAERLAVGWGAPLPSGAGTIVELAQQSGSAVEGALRFALAERYLPAAVAALEILGSSGDPSWLRSSGGEPRPVAQALRDPHPRVRFAALQAVLTLAPDFSFAGASEVGEALAYFSRTSGSRRIVLAHPRTDLAQTLSGFFEDLGFASEVVPTGLQAAQAARSRADAEIILLSDAVERPPVAELIQQLRRDPRTAALPIGVLARSATRDRLTRQLLDDPRCEVFAEPRDAAGAALVVRNLLGRASGDGLTEMERLQQAEWALAAWERLVAQPGAKTWYDLPSHESAALAALGEPHLLPLAAKVLGLHGSPAAQRTLVGLVNQSNRPLPEREAAAAAFATAVQRRGILLTSAEILEQYQQYNRSAAADAGTQRVLGAVLDTLESAGEETESAPNAASP